VNMGTPTNFQSRPGAYALLLSSAMDAVIRVGRWATGGSSRASMSTLAAHSGLEASVRGWLITCAPPSVPTGT
jgi:hypothetical protein